MSFRPRIAIMPDPGRHTAIAVVAIHITAYAACAAFEEPRPGSHWTMLPFLGLFLAQHSLLYLWAGLGTDRRRIRLAVAFAISVLAWSLPGIVQGEHPGWLVAALACNVAVLMAIVLVPLAVVRSWGFRLRRFDRSQIPAAREFQITILGMLTVTLVVAGLLALAASIGEVGVMRSRDQTRLSMPFMLLCLPILFSSSALLSVWAALSTGKVAIRMFVASAAVTAGGAFLPHCHDSDAATYAFWASLPLLIFLITSLTLLPFRWIGYRFLQAAPG